MLDENTFQKALNAIDEGDIETLRQLLHQYPDLANMRLGEPNEGYFKHPYLLWFIAGNPIRQEKMPENIVAITRLITNQVQKHAAKSFQHQIDYTLGLVATGKVARESGFQIELMNLLINEGAIARTVEGLLAHGNLDAARYLLSRGAKLTLAAAICLDLKDKIPQLAIDATLDEKQIALIAAAFYGKSEMISFLLTLGTDPNKYIDSSSGFHSHATALHQAVSAASLDSVKVLIEAGANPQLQDRIYYGTPLGWVKHIQAEEKNELKRNKYAEIEKYLIINLH